MYILYILNGGLDFKGSQCKDFFLKNTKISILFKGYKHVTIAYHHCIYLK